MYRSIIAVIIALFVIGVQSPISAFPTLRPLHAQAAEAQTDHLRNFEAQIIYLTNLKRRENGLPPVRWNRQLTEAARWLSSDAVENSDGRYCGHIDSLGRSPGERIKDFGYPRADTWAEHVVCGYVAPAAALEGWYRNETYRRQLLSPDVREVGVGYYVNPETGYGYVTQLLSADPDFSPLVINHEALNSTRSVDSRSTRSSSSRSLSAMFSGGTM